MIAMGETGVIRIELGIGMMVDGEMKGERGGTMVSGKGRGTIVGGIEIGIMGETEIEKGKGRGTEIETGITGGTEIGTEIDMTVNEIMPETEIGGAIVLAAKESVMIETEIMNEVRSEGETTEIGIGREKKREGTDETETDCDTTSATCNKSKSSYIIRYCLNAYGSQPLCCTSTRLSKPFSPGRQGTLLRSNRPYSWQSTGLSACLLRCYAGLTYFDSEKLHTGDKYRVILSVEFVRSSSDKGTKVVVCHSLLVLKIG